MEADVRSIAEVHVRSWQAAYRGQIPDRVLDNLSVEGCEEWWRRSLSQISEAVWVAEVNGKTVGFASTGPARGEGFDPSRTSELYAIYLDRESWGKGIGRRLLKAAEERLREQGFEDAILWVLHTNARARRFYEAAGWRHDGTTQTLTLQDAKLLEVRYRKEL